MAQSKIIGLGCGGFGSYPQERYANAGRKVATHESNLCFCKGFEKVVEYTSKCMMIYFCVKQSTDSLRRDQVSRCSYGPWVRSG